MDLAQQKETARRWIIGVWNEQNFELVGELATPDYVYRVPGQLEIKADALPAYVAALHAAFPDLGNTIEEQIAEPGIVVTRGTTRGTHLGPMGELAATGRKVALPWVMITRFAGGRVREDWELYDEHSLLQQLGVSE